jgi:hypothetical protein
MGTLATGCVPHYFAPSGGALFKNLSLRVVKVIVLKN